MTRLIAFLILIAVIVALTIYATVENRPSAYAMLFHRASAPVIPWTLNTRCAVNSKNLPLREPERNA